MSITAAVRIATCAAALLASGAVSLAAQGGFTVRVQVIDAASRSPLEGVAIALDDGLRGVSNAAGEFRFAGVPPRTWVLQAVRLGYATREQVVRVASDTVVTMELTVAAIPIDTLAIRRRVITVTGEVLGTDTRRAVPDADVMLGTRESATNGSGFFRFRDVAAGAPADIIIHGPGYLPATVSVDAMQDTTLRVMLEPDPVAQRMIAAQVQRLNRRSAASPGAVRRYAREDLLRHGAASLAEALRLLGGPPSTRRAAPSGCIIIDERPWPNGAHILNSYTPEEIERVEYVGGILRVYTFSFVRRTLAGKRMLVQIVPFVCQ
jgi:hypothetical protein